ncbi:hypothetical protein [Aneurinibacillus tyrosinisolvens]|uniref:hypothetical protein n=1 Tax=Aneurinibacillus tyrosinisolvens TaxID=1443435 RepID=UPI00063F8548|nr:hypothetical protein [Aneurinibacillus tyrosinisolvens]
MHGMKVRYEIEGMNLKVINVTLRDAENSYVLLKASDEKNNEIVFTLSHEQAEFLADEFYEANRRRKEHSSATSIPDLANIATEPIDEYTGDHFTS